MLKILSFLFIAALIGIVGFAASKPDTFLVERTLRMEATPDAIFPLVSDFANWQNWSPWAAKDPNMEVTLSDQTQGMGARYEWRGNSDVGEGRIEIVTVLPTQSVRLNLSIYEPFVANNVVQFMFEPFGDYTKVIWQVHGPMPFMSKVFSIFSSMDQNIGPDLDIGLARLKALVES